MKTHGANLQNVLEMFWKPARHELVPTKALCPNAPYCQRHTASCQLSETHGHGVKGRKEGASHTFLAALHTMPTGEGLQMSHRRLKKLAGHPTVTSNRDGDSMPVELMKQREWQCICPDNSIGLPVVLCMMPAMRQMYTIAQMYWTFAGEKKVLGLLELTLLPTYLCDVSAIESLRHLDFPCIFLKANCPLGVKCKQPWSGNCVNLHIYSFNRL